MRQMLILNHGTSTFYKITYFVPFGKHHLIPYNVLSDVYA